MNRTTLAILFNFLFLPMGFYYLKQPTRFWIFAGLTLVLPLFLIGVHGIVFAATGSAPLSLGWILIATIGWTVVWARETLRAARQPPSDAAYLQRPMAYWVAPGLMLGLILVGLGIDVVRDGFFARAQHLTAPSMAPGFLVRDYVLIESVDPANLERGDVIAYDTGEGSTYLKRIVALPGDTLSLPQTERTFAGRVYSTTSPRVNEVEHPQTCAVDEANAAALAVSEDEAPRLLCEERIGERTIQMLEGAGTDPSSYGLLAEPFTLGPEEYFVLGDNRDDARDSRYMGSVSAESIRGRYMYTYFSMGFKHPEDAMSRDEIMDCARTRPGMICHLQNLMRMQIRWDRIAIITP